MALSAGLVMVHGKRKRAIHVAVAGMHVDQKDYGVVVKWPALVVVELPPMKTV